MKLVFAIAFCAAISGACVTVDGTMYVGPFPSRDVVSVREAPGEPLTPVPFQDVKITDPFWSARIETNRTSTIEANLKKCAETGRIKNFAVCAKLEPGEHEGALYNDSDVYKILEGVAYSLSTHPDRDLEARADEIIDLIVAAQQPDGYLNTYWTLVKPNERWTNIRYGHELYCSGHMIEGAIAYFHATGKRKWLDCAIRLADCIDRTFGPNGKREPTGHPELELALVKLFHETNEARYLKLAEFFLDQRGDAEHHQLFGDYAQDHKPLREQREVVGHAVRAMYLYSGAADVAGITHDEKLWTALDAIWHDVVDRKMYLTGGIGPSASNEGFTVPYDLPNDTAYCETCASIGMALWNQRMFLATGDAKYADVVEREIYNGVLSGVSLSGDAFFYDNPLASKGQHARVPWFDCSCCPSNLVRFIPAIGERIYATRGDTLFVAQFIASEANVKLAGTDVAIRMKSGWPYDGSVSIAVDPAEEREFEVRVRWPSWCTAPIGSRFDDSKTGERSDRPLTMRVVDGFLALRRTWRAGDRLMFDCPMTPTLVKQDDRVTATLDRRALQRGPLVYCFEGADNAGSVRNFALGSNNGTSPFETSWRIEDRVESAKLPNDAPAIAISGWSVKAVDGKREVEPAKLIGLPYCLWANRGKNEMVVWLPIEPELAELPGRGDSLSQNGAKITASHCWQNDTLAALNDGVLPTSSNDESIPRLTFWDHRGTTEWVQYDFEKPTKLHSTSVFWFDDSGRGSCRVPKSWRALSKDGDTWKPLVLASGSSYGVARDALQKVEFEPRDVESLRIEIEQQDSFSSGILEWRVE